MNFKKILLLLLIIFINLDAIEFNKNKTINLKEGVYFLKDISLDENITIRGENKFTTILKLDKNAKKAMFYAKDKSNIEISNLTLLNETTQRVPLLKFEGDSKQIKNITIKDCILKSPKAEADVIVFKKYISNIRILDNFIEAKKNPKIRRNYKQISGIRLQGVTTHSKNNSFVYIKNNIIKYGNSGFRIAGVGTPPNPLWFEGNIVQGQIGCGAFFYHGSRQKIINNYFSNITAVSMQNNDGGVVWLDQYKDGDILFSGNTIENNYGNGIYVEELQNAIITNNFIYNNKKRVNDTYSVKIKKRTYKSDGGSGILVTGGVEGLQINNNQIRNNGFKGILLNTKLGVHIKYKINFVSINGNHLENNLLNKINNNSSFNKVLDKNNNSFIFKPKKVSNVKK